MPAVILPFSYIPDPTIDRSLFSGFAYFGIPNTDPTIPANQYQVRKAEDDGTFTNLNQPIQTGPGGVFLDAGSPVQLDIVETRYSIQIFDRNNVQIYAFGQAGPGGTSGRDILLSQGGLPFDPTVTTAGPTFNITEVHTNALIRIDSSVAVTINLPSAALIGDKFRVGIKKVDDNASHTIDADGGDLIEGAGVYTLAERQETVWLLCDGTQWNLIQGWLRSEGFRLRQVEVRSTNNLTDINRLETNVEALPRVFAAAHVQADGTLTWGYNLSVTRTATGVYTYDFTNNLPAGTADDVAFQAITTAGQRFISVTSNTVTGFVVNIQRIAVPDTIVAQNQEHFVTVFAPNTSIPTS